MVEAILSLSLESTYTYSFGPPLWDRVDHSFNSPSSFPYASQAKLSISLSFFEPLTNIIERGPVLTFKSSLSQTAPGALSYTYTAECRKPIRKPTRPECQSSDPKERMKERAWLKSLLMRARLEADLFMILVHLLLIHIWHSSSEPG